MFCKRHSHTLKCKVMELSKGTYSKMVIQDLESLEYVMLTVFPNWQGEIPSKNQIGYIEFEFVEAGTEYYNKDLKIYETYSNTHLIFKTFIQETPKNQEDVTL